MNLRKSFSFIIVFLSFLNPTSYANSLIVYRDFTLKGDENQVQGIIQAYRNMDKNLEVQEFNINQAEDLKAFLKTLPQNDKNKPVLLGVGEKTISQFSELLPLEDVVTAHLCHMLTNSHTLLVGKVDFIALPVHAVGNFEQEIKGTRTNLIKTTGVSHNREISIIEDIYNKNKSKIPQNDSYLGVILGGDAPKPNHEILLFTESDARKLASSVAATIGTRHILIINGPRTGKYNPTPLLNNSYEEIKSAHRDGKIDFVTHSFVDELEKNGLTRKQFTLFDFQFSPVPNQDMNLLLGAIRATHSSVLVPGESTSAVSECIDVLEPDSVIVYQNSAMNPTHHKHIESELEASRIKLLTTGYSDLGPLLEKTKESKKQVKDVEKTSAAKKIVSELIKYTSSQ